MFGISNISKDSSNKGTCDCNFCIGKNNNQNRSKEQTLNFEPKFINNDNNSTNVCIIDPDDKSCWKY